MLNWLCTKAHPHLGTLRTSWPVLALQTGLSSAHVMRLCRSLRRKRYVFFTSRRGQLRWPIEVAIHKFPLPGDVYTDLSACFASERSTATGGEIRRRSAPKLAATQASQAVDPDAGARTAEGPAELPAEVMRDFKTDVVLEAGSDPERQLRGTSGSSAPPIREEEDRRRESPEHRAAQAPGKGSIAREAALAAAPPALRETLRLYCRETGRTRVSRADLDRLARLGRIHPPTATETALSTVVARAVARGRPPGTVTLEDVGRSLQHPIPRHPPDLPPPPARRYPPGVTRLE